MMYKTFCTSVIGASHIRTNRPKEDYGLKIEKSDYKIFVTADGHGAKECFRSKDGARIVCEVVSKELETLYKHIRENNLTEEFLSTKNTSDYLIHCVMEAVIYKWKEAVKEDYEKNTPSKEELELLSSRIEKAYGTTFIAGIITDEYALLMQQGDGHCVAFDINGKSFIPIPEDPNCIGNVTTSMCDTNVLESYRYKIINLKNNPLLALFLGSDGVEDCYGANMEKTINYYQKLIEEIYKNGIEEFETYLEHTLPINSEKGSADDITITGCIDIEMLGKKYNKFNILFKQQQELTKQQARLNKASEKIESMQRKRLFLKKKSEDLQEEYDKLLANKDFLRKECRSNFENFKMTENKYNNSFRELKKIIENKALELEESRKDYEESQGKILDYMLMQEEARNEIEKIKKILM